MNLRSGDYLVVPANLTRILLTPNDNETVTLMVFYLSFYYFVPIKQYTIDFLVTENRSSRLLGRHADFPIQDAD